MYKPLKSPTTYQQQISLLKNRHILITDDAFGEDFLSRVSYYRLTGYLLPYIIKPSEICKNDLPFKQLVSVYDFDTEIRNLIAITIEKIEIFIRCRLSYYSAHKYGSEGYMDVNNYNRKHNHIDFTGRINSCIKENSKAPVVQHHISEYGGRFPIWVIIDYFSLGMLSHFYTDWKNADKAKIASDLYGVNYQILTSWLRCLTDLRNRCAHYSRLYYWIFPAMPAMPANDPFVVDRRLFSQLYMLKLMYPEPDKWNTDFMIPLRKIMKKYKPFISREHIGFPYRWNHILTYK